MKKGDIVVYTQLTQHNEFPKNVRDGVVVDIKDNKVFVRPYGCKWTVVLRHYELRTILPNRLRSDRQNNIRSKPTAKTEARKPSDYQTYMGWKAIGRYVMKGEQHRKRNDRNECLFHISQTKCSITEQPKSYKRNWSKRRYDVDEDIYRHTTEPYEISREVRMGMGGKYDYVEMSDGTHREEHNYDVNGDDAVPRGISLGM